MRGRGRLLAALAVLSHYSGQASANQWLGQSPEPLLAEQRYAFEHVRGSEAVSPTFHGLHPIGANLNYFLCEHLICFAKIEFLSLVKQVVCNNMSFFYFTHFAFFSPNLYLFQPDSLNLLCYRGLPVVGVSNFELGSTPCP